MKKVLYICARKAKFLCLSEKLKGRYTLYRAESFSKMTGLMETISFFSIIVEKADFPEKIFIEILRENTGKDSVPLFVLGETPEISEVVLAMKLGAYDFIAGNLGILINKLEELSSPKKCSYNETASIVLPELIGTSEFIKDLKEILSLYSENDLNFCIYGETGTGKGLLASLLHQLRYEGKRPFISRNCSAIPETLFEAEAFGSERGAFTGAIQRPGFFEQAGNGTLFLDEIGELPLSSQGKLLKVIEDKKVVRVGGEKERACPCTLFSATNRDLKKEKKKGRFRADLYYRINTLTVEIPPLRERKEDIPELANYFLQKFEKKSKDGEQKCFTEAAMNLLMEHSWPGNIRELEMTVIRARVHSGKSRWIKISHIFLE